MDWWKTVLPLQGAPSYDDKKLGREHDMESGGPDPEVEDKVMLKRHRVSRIFWNRHFFDYPISLSPNTLKAMGFKLTMVAGFSYLKSMFHKLPEDNLENFYINRFGRKLYSMFFEGYTEKLWGRHPSQISADWGAQRVKGLSIMGVLKNAFQKLLPKQRSNAEVETSLIEEFWYPKYGPGQLWETVESNCENAGVKVLTDATVVELRQNNGSISSVVYEDSEGNRTELAAISSSRRCRSRLGQRHRCSRFRSGKPRIQGRSCRHDQGGQRPAVPRLRDRGSSGQAPEAQEHHEHSHPRQPADCAGLLDLCSGSGLQGRPSPDLQQLEPVPGQGRERHRVGWSGVLLRRG